QMLLENGVRHLAQLDEAHLAGSVDKDADRQTHIHTIRSRDLTRGVVDRRESGVDFAQKSLHRAGARLLVIDSEDLQALSFVDIAGPLDQRHLVLALRAPGGPEIQQDRLAAILAEPDPADAESLTGEVRRSSAD